MKHPTFYNERHKKLEAQNAWFKNYVYGVYCFGFSFNDDFGPFQNALMCDKIFAMNYGFVRCACASPELVVANVEFNTQKILQEAQKCSQNGASVIVFPELCLSGYTCSDLFFQKTLQTECENALSKIISFTKNSNLSNSVIFVGLPVALTEGIYNCAAIVFNGRLLALIPKTYLPNYAEFYERRQFTPYSKKCIQYISFAGFDEVPFGTNILISDKTDSSFTMACEICEDVWVPLPPSTYHVLNGATVIANLSSGNEIIGKTDYRRSLIKTHSARNVCAYLYANSSKDESSTDMVFAGHNLICENGTLLKQSELFSGETIYADIDVERLVQERRKISSFSDCCKQGQTETSEYLTIKIDLLSKACSIAPKNLLRFVDAHPFVPSSKDARSERCKEVITLQAQGLAKRLRHISCNSALIGLSGGLDSTLALLVTARAFDLCGIERKKITAITMPCFGTTDRTYHNACTLATECGVSLKEVRIAQSVLQHMHDIEQDENTHDVTYENCQARERTQVLMDYANKTNGIVIGTGDLSELALGWCTYNGDHMSMYGVNSSVPKTLVRYLVEWFSQEELQNGNEKFSSVLADILATPVSPELLPPKDGKIAQVTEDLVGPYELHDFYLYYLLRFGFEPEKILFLAENSSLPYSTEVKIKWLKNFYKRFFSQQFKRSCMPDGAKVGTVNLSPRGDWRMPSDASAKIWLSRLDSLDSAHD